MSENTEIKGWMYPAALVLMVLMGAYGAWATGYCLSHLWSWYAVPFGFRAVDWQPFSALALGLGLLTYKANRHKDDRPKIEQRLSGVSLLLMPWVALAIGWWFK